MRLLVFLICCVITVLSDQQAESTEVQTTNKLSSTKSSLNAIPTGPSQKGSLLQQTHQQYIPQYVVQKQVSVVPSQQTHQHHQSSGQPAAMFIIAQPTGQSASQNTLFQQAVQQLLSYYNNNPQARYQLLQQQGGIPQQHIPQTSQQPQISSQSAYHSQFPTGALHVIPSPHLDTASNNYAHQAPTASAATLSHQHQVSATQSPHQQPQAIYAIPASSQMALNSISPGLLAQFTNQLSAQTQSVPVHLPMQYSMQQLLPQSINHNQLPTQYYAQLPASFGGQFATTQFPAHFHSQLSPQYALATPQFAQYQYQTQPQVQSALNHHHQPLPLKQNSISNAVDYMTQVSQSQNTEKGNTQSASSNYTPVYRTAYIKG